MMNCLKKSAWARFLRVAAASCVCAAAFAYDALGADLVRFVQRDKSSGEYEEGTRSGAILSFSKSGVSFEYSASGGEKKTIDLKSEQVLWLQFEEEPLALAAARVESQVGNYEEALAKIDEIDAGEVKNDLIAAEIEWARCEATMELAFAGAGEFEKAVLMMKTFVENAPDHYRFYEANAMLGDAAIALKKPSVAKKYYGALADAPSETAQARGKVGLAQAAFDAGELDAAKTLFAEPAGKDSLDAMLEGLNVRADAQIGLARVLAAQGETDEALKTLGALLDATPNSATRRQALVYNALGDVYASADKAQEAIVAYLHVDLLYPAARAERVKALSALAPLWDKVGRKDRAEETRRILRERFSVEIDE